LSIVLVEEALRYLLRSGHAVLRPLLLLSGWSGRLLFGRRRFSASLRRLGLILVAVPAPVELADQPVAEAAQRHPPTTSVPDP
jgi:hypothetical protein